MITPRQRAWRCLVWLVLLLGAAGGWAGCESVSEGDAPDHYTYRVERVLYHDPRAFTQGLVIDDGVLYEGTGLRGQSRIERRDLETGELLGRRDLPSLYFGEGVTVFRDHVIQLTWTSGVGFVYDKTSLEPRGEFRYATEGWGLTHDGTRLVMSDGTATLHFLDPVTFAELGRITVRDGDQRVERLNELEYVGGEIYANVWQTDRIARIDPESGRVLGWIDLAGILDPATLEAPVDVLNGIAYDAAGDRLFVTGKLWPAMFEIEVVPAPN